MYYVDIIPDIETSLHSFNKPNLVGMLFFLFYNILFKMFVSIHKWDQSTLFSLYYLYMFLNLTFTGFKK